MRIVKSYLYDLLLYVCNYVVAYFPSSRFRLAFYRVFMRIKIGENVSIMSGAWIDTKGKFTIGKNSVINQRCRLDNRGGIEIAENVSISPGVHIITADHDIQSPDFRGRHGKVVIGNRVFVGSRATILPGVNVGEGAVIAACACVTRDVPPFTVVGGVPAKEILQRSEVLLYELNYHRHFF